MGVYPIQLPSASGLIAETAVKNIYKEVKEVDPTRPAGEFPPTYEEVEKVSSLQTYKGGSLLGWWLYAPEKARVIFYDNIEKEEGTKYGPISFNEHESSRDWFGANGIKFKTALYYKILEGKLEGQIFVDIE